jgi:Ran GTPase-activating protein (RanGAP) involved in mRNA processing and transport
MPLVKSAGDMVQMFSAKTAPDRVAARYGAARDLAIQKYITYATPFRIVVEMAREKLIKLGVPSGRWGVHFAFVEVLKKIAMAYKGIVPENIINALKAEYVAKGADPAVLDELVKIVIA